MFQHITWSPQSMVIVGSASRGPTCLLDLVINDDEPSQNHSSRCHFPNMEFSWSTFRWFIIFVKRFHLMLSKYPPKKFTRKFPSELCFVPTNPSNQPTQPTNQPTNPTQPNPTQPNPTQPNPTQPIQRRIYCRPWTSPTPLLADQGFYGDQVRNGWEG